MTYMRSVVRLYPTARTLPFSDVETVLFNFFCFLPVACFRYDVALFRESILSNRVPVVCPLSLGVLVMAACDVGRFVCSHSIPPFGNEPGTILCHSK
jgi:hypothetical protein